MTSLAKLSTESHKEAVPSMSLGTLSFLHSLMKYIMTAAITSSSQ